MLKVSLDESHRRYMDRCRILAKDNVIGIGKPFVGAVVLAEDGEIIGEGYKRLIPGTKLTMHAERAALQDAGIKRPKTLYTTLEPCTRRHKHIFTPCSELIVERGIELVVFGVYDYSAHFFPGQGIKFLLENRVQVIRYPTLNAQIVHDLMQQQFKQNYSEEYEKELDKRLS